MNIGIEEAQKANGLAVRNRLWGNQAKAPAKPVVFTPLDLSALDLPDNYPCWPYKKAMPSDEIEPVIQAICDKRKMTRPDLLRTFNCSVFADARKELFFHLVFCHGFSYRAISNFIGMHPGSIYAQARWYKNLHFGSPEAATVLNLNRDVIDVGLAVHYMTESDLIIKQVAMAHGVTVIDMISKRRDKPTVLARQEAMYRMRKETTPSLPAIGRKFNKDHTTVIYGIICHKAIMDAALNAGTGEAVV